MGSIDRIIGERNMDQQYDDHIKEQFFEEAFVRH